MAEESSLKHRNHTGQNCTSSRYNEGKSGGKQRDCVRVLTGSARLTAAERERRVLAVWREARAGQRPRCGKINNNRINSYSIRNK